MTVPVQPAATVAPLRDGAHGLEVLLLQRSPALVFAPGAWVFPGGRVDEAVATWRELADDTNAGYPSDLALAGLARTLENAGQGEEATIEWQKILDLYPDSPVAAEARRAAEAS